MSDSRAEVPYGSRALALLRASLLAVIAVAVWLLDARHLGGRGFAIAMAIAGAFALAGLALAFFGVLAARLSGPQSALSVALLTGLTMTSGGAFSNARWAFFVIPLFAAFRERPRVVAGWSLAAAVAFTSQAAIVRGHVAGSVNSWLELTIIQDVYLAWGACAATLLALVLRERSARIVALAESRKRLVTEAIASVERERTRLAGDLHDRPVQSLIAARHDLRRAQRTGDLRSFGQVRQALEETIVELREEIFKLHPHVLDHVGLDAAVRQLAQRHAHHDRLAVTVELDPAADRRHSEVLFWLARELMGNVAQHANANTLDVRLVRDVDSVTLQVADDGVGIPDGRLRDAVVSGHVGLASIAERVHALGGSVEITTAVGRGTTVRVLLPAEPLTHGAPRPGRDPLHRPAVRR